MINTDSSAADRRLLIVIMARNLPRIAYEHQNIVTKEHTARRILPHCTVIRLVYGNGLLPPKLCQLGRKARFTSWGREAYELSHQNRDLVMGNYYFSRS